VPEEPLAAGVFSLPAGSGRRVAALQAGVRRCLAHDRAVNPQQTCLERFDALTRSCASHDIQQGDEFVIFADLISASVTAVFD